jgi:diguanylate cyclase (GGDEF)-like protein
MKTTGTNKPAAARRRHKSSLSNKDPLTQLSTRNQFNKRLQTMVTNARQTPFSLILLGLDRFRDINHIFGPKNGDVLLAAVARRFAAAVEVASFKAALGGDEFAAIISAVNERAITTICEGILRGLDPPFVIDKVPVDISGSIGVAMYPAHGVDADSILQRANIALEYTKQFGRGFSFYDAATDPYTELKRAYVGGLRNAIEQGHIALSYQPKVALGSGKIIGVEALVQWRHPELGVVPASQFVPAAERTGLIHALSRWILRAAVAQCKDWCDSGFEVPVAVNLSPRNFHDRHLPGYIDHLLTAHDLAPQLIEIEITESAILTDVSHVSQALETLSGKGIRIFIDDFGTGYSSLGHVKNLPIAGVKIDQTFVRHVMADENDAAIVRSIVDLGHRLGLQVIAEGAESQAICDKLADLGCDAVQGYFMSPPLSGADLKKWATGPLHSKRERSPGI